MGLCEALGLWGDFGDMNNARNSGDAAILLGDDAGFFSTFCSLGWIGQAFLVLVVIRMMQRLYFMARGHSHYFIFDPPKALYKFFEEKGVACQVSDILKRRGYFSGWLEDD